MDLIIELIQGDSKPHTFKKKDGYRWEIFHTDPNVQSFLKRTE